MIYKSHQRLQPWFGILLILLFFSLSFSHGQVLVKKHLKVQSNILNRYLNYNIILPENYYKDTCHYPVIYLLHGFGGNQHSWLVLGRADRIIDSLVAAKKAKEYIYILPDADNSYYINNFDNSVRYEDFFIDEFIPYIDSVFRTRSERSLMGLSMGGYGSVVLAIKNTSLFKGVISMSGALRDDRSFKNMLPKHYEIFFADVFGPGLIGEQRITEHWKQNSPFHLVDSVNAPTLREIEWFVECGTEDPLFIVNESFHKLLLSYSIPHEYYVRPGKHDWTFWSESFIHGLIFLSKTDS